MNGFQHAANTLEMLQLRLPRHNSKTGSQNVSGSGCADSILNLSQSSSDVSLEKRTLRRTCCSSTWQVTLHDVIVGAFMVAVDGQPALTDCIQTGEKRCRYVRHDFRRKSHRTIGVRHPDGRVCRCRFTTSKRKTDFYCETRDSLRGISIKNGNTIRNS